MKFTGYIKDAVTIISIVATLGLGYWGAKQKQETLRYRDNLQTVTTQWTNDKGQLVTTVNELRFTNDELKAIAKQDSSKLSETQKKLWEAGELIKDLNIKEKDVESVTSNDLEAVHVNETTIVEDRGMMKIEPIRSKHLNVDFEVDGSKVIATSKYKASISTVVDRHRDKHTMSGNKRFFLARWVNPRWQYDANTVCDDPDAKITSSIHIKFQSNKGRR